MGVLPAVAVGQLRQGVDNGLGVHLQVGEGLEVVLGHLLFGRRPRRREPHFGSSLSQL